MNAEKHVFMLFIALAAAIYPLHSVHGAEVEGCFFSEYYEAENKKLRLVGAGLLRYWGFKAYTGAFYLEESVAVDQALSDRAKRIEIEYLRPIEGKDFGPATDKGIAQNVDSETYKRLRPQIDYHNSLYEDVQPGDRYSLTYIPGKGTELALNGEPKGMIEGADFAAAIFSIWLGAEPLSESFKDQIVVRMHVTGVKNRLYGAKSRDGLTGKKTMKHQKMKMINKAVNLFLLATIWMLSTGCQTMKPIHTVEAVDLKRFMGDWYVIASIPTFIEKNAYNAVESYRLDQDGTVATTFKFNKGDFNGPLKVYTPRGFVQDKSSNAVWGMQFVWPFKAEYRIIYLTEDYSQTVIGRTKRDYVWIMAREPSIPEEDYDRILGFLKDQGYKLDNLRKVPHRPAGSGA